MTGSTARVFFALWPDETVRAALAQTVTAVHAECGGRAMAAANIHATLAFIGNVPKQRLTDLEQLAGALDGSSFELSIDGLSYWRHNRIVWAGGHTCPPQLAALASDLQHALKTHQWHVDERPYVLHITLLRDARRAPAITALQPIPWRVSKFALVLSHNDAAGTHYTPLAFWRLRG